MRRRKKIKNAERFAKLERLEGALTQDVYTVCGAICLQRRSLDSPGFRGWSNSWPDYTAITIDNGEPNCRPL